MKSLLLAAFLLILMYLIASNAQEIQAATTGLSIPNVQTKTGAVHQVQRLNQLSQAQYDSPQEYQQWWPSACAAASVAVVLNRYGGNYRVHDVLQVMIDDGDISSDAGLLSHEGLAHTAAHYHLNAVLNERDTLDHVIAVANSGNPVIVNWPPGRFFGGHFVVVRGGNASTVFLADSSSYNYTSLPREKFLSFWGEPGFSAVLTPQ